MRVAGLEAVNHMEVRAAAVNWLRAQNPAEILADNVAAEGDANAWLERMSQQGVDGDDRTLAAAAMHYGISIAVYQNIEQRPYLHEPAAGRGHVAVYYHGQHYQALVLLNGPNQM